MGDHDQAFSALRAALLSYAPLSESTWQAFKAICQCKVLAKKQLLYRIGDSLDSFAFIHQGLVRAYVIDEDGHEYNKMFFNEGMFPGSMSALLTNSASILEFQALEPSVVVEINFSEFRQQLFASKELMRFQIAYLEKNWLLAKDLREIEIVQEGASERYLRFLTEHPGLANRLTQYHIASHLGVTPTQLSRIRKNLGNI